MKIFFGLGANPSRAQDGSFCGQTLASGSQIKVCATSSVTLVVHGGKRFTSEALFRQSAKAGTPDPLPSSVPSTVVPNEWLPERSDSHVPPGRRRHLNTPPRPHRTGWKNP